MARFRISSAICIVIIVIVASLQLKLSYQLSEQLQRSQEITFCAKSSADSTVKTFWTEATSSCSKDPYKLMDLYETMRNKAAQSADGESKCNKLLLHQLRKTLIDSSAALFEDAIIAATLSQQKLELERLAKRLSLLDSRILLAVWERAIDEVYWFVNKLELAETLHSNFSTEAKVMGLLWLYWKYEKGPDLDAGIPSKITYYLSEIRSQPDYSKLPPELQQGVEKTFESLPKLLQLLYAKGKADRFLGLLNTAHWEYLYAPRENGPDELRRTPLTWIREKNSTDSDGKLLIEVNSAANVAIASFFGRVPKYLYVEEVEQQLYFGFGEGALLGRWWRVEWHKEDYLTFEHLQTQRLLCATREYDESRRYVTLGSSNANSPECRWTLREL